MRSSATRTTARRARASRPRPGARAISRTGTPAPRGCGALSRGSRAPARCSCAAASMRRREGEVCQRVGLGLLGHVGGLGAAPAQHVAGDVVHVAGGRRVLRAEHALLSDKTLRVCVSCEVDAGLVWPTLIIYWIAGGCEKSSFIGAITILFVLSNSIKG